MTSLFALMQVFKRCKKRIFLSEKKMGFMECLDMPGTPCPPQLIRIQPHQVSHQKVIVDEFLANIERFCTASAVCLDLTSFTANSFSLASLSCQWSAA